MAEGLHARISADTGDFERDINQARDSASKLAQSIRDAGTQAKAFRPAAESARAGFGVFRDNAKQTTSQFQKMAKEAKKVNGVFKAQKGITTQLGFQLQDIAVQAQSGTNAFVILGQQGSQIASLFGPGGALVGAFLAIAAAVGGVAFAMKDGKEKTDDFHKSFLDLQQSLANKGLFELTNDADDAAAKVKILEDAIDSLNDERLIGPKTGEELQFINDQIDQLTPLLRAAKDSQRSVNQEIEKFVKFRAGIEEARGALTQQRLQKSLSGGQDLTDVQKAQKRLAIIRQFDDQEVAQAQAKFNLLREQLKAALASESITQTEHNTLLRDAEQQHQEMLTKIKTDAWMRNNDIQMQLAQAAEQAEKVRQDRMVKGAQDFWSNMTSLTNSGSRKLFEVGKIAAISRALLNARESIVSSYRVGSEIGGPPVGAAFAAAAAAATASQIQAIKSTSFGGGGSSSNAAGTADSGTPATAASPENRIANIELIGDGFSRDQVRDLFVKLNGLADEGFRFNVS